MNRLIKRHLLCAAFASCVSAGVVFGQTDRTTDTTRDSRPVAARNDVGFNPSWLGLIGLVGLAGLMGRSETYGRDTRTTGTATMAR
jgi:hypothetical protein